MNSNFIEQRAEALALRADVKGGGDATAKVQRLFRLTLSRPARPEELAACLNFVEPARRPGPELAKLLLELKRITLLKLRVVPMMMTRREALRNAGNGFGMLGLVNLLATSRVWPRTRLSGAPLSSKSEACHLSVPEWWTLAGRYFRSEAGPR